MLDYCNICNIHLWAGNQMNMASENQEKWWLETQKHLNRSNNPGLLWAKIQIIKAKGQSFGIRAVSKWTWDKPEDKISARSVRETPVRASKTQWDTKTASQPGCVLESSEEFSKETRA